MSAVWYQPIPPANRVIGVNDVGSLRSALTFAQFGDHIIPAPGDYPINDWLDIPAGVILRSLNYGVNLTGMLRMAAHCWVIGLGVSFPNATFGGSLIQANADGCFVINNWLHHSISGTNAILTGGGSNGGLTYGNICHDTRHVAYVQNSSLTVPRYFVHNYFGDVIPSGNSFNIHAYTETANNMLALRFYENVIANGAATIGGAGNATPPFDCQFIGDFFYRNSFSPFYLPHGTMFKKCKFYRSVYANDLMWGDGEGKYFPSQPTIFTRNDFYDPDGGFGPHVITARFLSDGTRQHDGQAPLHPRTKFDDNRYFKQFHGALGANGIFQADVTKLGDWRAYSASAGKLFDLHSSVVAHPPKDSVTTFPNVYDASRSLMIVENWSGNGVVVDANLSPIHDPFSPPVFHHIVSDPEVSVWVRR